MDINNIDREILKLLDQKYSVIDCYIVKGIKNGEYTELIIKTKASGAEIGRLWFNPKNYITDKPNKHKKHTGGRPSYVKLYLSKLKELDLTIEQSGALLALAHNIAWHTGRIINKRSKKPLKQDEIIQLWRECKKGEKKPISKPTGQRIIRELKELNLLKHTSEGYFISPDFIQKGGVKRDTNKN